MLLLVHTSILPTKQNIYAIPPPFSLLGAQDVLLSCPAQRNATFILVGTIFDKLWRQRKKAAYSDHKLKPLNHVITLGSLFAIG